MRESLVSRSIGLSPVPPVFVGQRWRYSGSSGDLRVVDMRQCRWGVPRKRRRLRFARIIKNSGHFEFRVLVSLTTNSACSANCVAGKSYAHLVIFPMLRGPVFRNTGLIPGVTDASTSDFVARSPSSVQAVPLCMLRPAGNWCGISSDERFARAPHLSAIKLVVGRIQLRRDLVRTRRFGCSLSRAHSGRAIAVR